MITQVKGVIQKFSNSKKKTLSHEEKTRLYTKYAIKKYGKTLRKLSYE